MKRFLCLLLPVFLLSCKSTPEKISADIASLRKSAERGNAGAQWELGNTYMKLGNWNEANPWLQKASERGIIQAQYQLAQNYEKGQGIAQNFIEAYAWFFVASERGHLQALNGRERLTRLLSHADLEEANRKAFEYATKVPGKKEKETSTGSPKETSATDKKPNLAAPKSE